MARLIIVRGRIVQESDERLIIVRGVIVQESSAVVVGGLSIPVAMHHYTKNIRSG